MELEEAKAEIERLKKVEEDNKNLLEECERLKTLVSKSCKDDIFVGDNLVQELEEKLKNAENELKWKIEQFKHLEEAHEKLKDQFNLSKHEWEIEKSSMFVEISRLEENLDTECTTAQAGEEGVADLRHLLRVKEIECKDLDYKAKKLEVENRELLISIKELQEDRIMKSVTPNSHWVKLKSKMKILEKTHKDCSSSFKAKEAEWNFRAHKMSGELSRCSSSLKVKDDVIDVLKNEMEECHSSLTQLKLQNEELSLMLQLMKSENSGNDSDQKNAEKDDSSLAKDLYVVEKELTDRTNEVRDLEVELEEWKSLAHCLKKQVDGIQDIRRELELSLLDQTEMEELLKQDVEDKNQRISNLQQQISLIDQEILIREEDETSARWQGDDDDDDYEDEYEDEDDQHEEELLAKELEEAVLTHIREEKRYLKAVENDEEIHLKVKVGRTMDDDDDESDDVESDETSSAKENVNMLNSILLTKTSFIEERSPFKVLN